MNRVQVDVRVLAASRLQPRSRCSPCKPIGPSDNSALWRTDADCQTPGPAQNQPRSPSLDLSLAVGYLQYPLAVGYLLPFHNPVTPVKLQQPQCHSCAQFPSLQIPLPQGHSLVVEEPHLPAARNGECGLYSQTLWGHWRSPGSAVHAKRNNTTTTDPRDEPRCSAAGIGGSESAMDLSHTASIHFSAALASSPARNPTQSHTRARFN